MPRRRVRRNSSERPKSLTYGTLPEYPAFAAHVEAWRDWDGAPVVGPPGDVYHMELVGNEIAAAKAALKVLFASGARVKFDQFTPTKYPYKYGLRFHDLVSLHKFLLALVTIYEMEQPEAAEPDDDGGDRGDVGEVAADLASSIMTTLGYEWV